MVRATHSDDRPGWSRGQWVVARETPGKWRVFSRLVAAGLHRRRDFDYRFKRTFYADPEFRRAFFPDEGPIDETDRSGEAWVVRLGPAAADAMTYALQLEERASPWCSTASPRTSPRSTPTARGRRSCGDRADRGRASPKAAGRRHRPARVDGLGRCRLVRPGECWQRRIRNFPSGRSRSRWRWRAGRRRR
jgi:hypothetical protein